MKIIQDLIKSGNLYLYLSLSGVINFLILLSIFEFSLFSYLELIIFLQLTVYLIIPIVLLIRSGKKINIKDFILEYIIGFTLTTGIIIASTYLFSNLFKVDESGELEALGAVLYYVFFGVLIGVIINLIISSSIVLLRKSKN